MDAFEQIAARLFEVKGYWTRIGYTVELTKAQKASIGQPSLRVCSSMSWRTDFPHTSFS